MLYAKLYLIIYLSFYAYSNSIFMVKSMIFFSCGNNRSNIDNKWNKGNWNRGQQAGWPRGRNKILRFYVHFDADSKEFNQLLQTSLLILAGQGYFNPPPPLFRPPLWPHPNITGIHVEPHVFMQLEIPVNDGWNELVYDPQPHNHVWPTISLPLPPPLPKKPLQPAISMASHALSVQQPKKHKTLGQEPKPSKGKQSSCSPSSGSLDNSSHFDTSHSIP